MKRWAVAALAVLVVGQAGVIAGLVNWNGAFSESTEPPAAVTPTPVAPPAAVQTPPATTPVAPGPVPSAQEAPATPVAAPAVAPGHLEVTSDPSGARVTVNGVERGTTPTTIAVEPGSHVVVVSDGRSSTTRTLDVAAGANVTMMAALTPPGPSVGWVTIQSPLELQVISDASLLGTSKTAKIIMSAGRHVLELVHPPTGFQMTSTVDIQPGKTVRIPVTLPNGTLSVNALPWATVWIDGKEMGQTPVANVTLPIGAHELVTRHPELGERKQTVIVSAKTPQRVVIDFGK